MLTHVCDAGGADWSYSNLGVSNCDTRDAATVPGSACYVPTLLATLDAATKAKTRAVFLNWGANDITTFVAETWKANIATIVAWIQADMPAATIYLAKPWCTWTGVGTSSHDAEFDAMATAVDEAVAACGAGCAVGIDERNAGGVEYIDLGATYTTDGVHYSQAGHQLVGNLWAAVLGY